MLRLQRRCADGERAEAPAELREHRAEEQAAHEAWHALGDGVQTLELRPLAGGVHLALDGVAEQAQALRDDEKHGDLELAEGAHQHRGLPADRVHDRLPGGQRRQQVAGQPEHV